MSVRIKAGRIGCGLWLVAAGIGVMSRELAGAPLTPTMYPPAVAGPQVTLSWSAVPGAAGYRLSIALSPGGPDAYAQIVGPQTAVTFRSPYVGTAYVRAQALDASGVSARSNEQPLVVATLTPVPAAPVNLQAFLNGRAVTLTWGPGAGGGPPLAVQVEVGTMPGAANLGIFPLPLSTSVGVPNVAPGTYFARVYGVNHSGRSAPSNEVRVDVPPGGGCTPLAASVLTASVAGAAVSFAWPPVAGAAAYRLEVASGPAGPVFVSQLVPSTATSIGHASAPAGTYYARISTRASCGAETPSAVVSFTVAGGGGGGTGPRAPNPPPGQRLPLPNMSNVVYAIGNAYPNELRNSCGNNFWLFRLVQELRRYDTRWGLNWKRGNVGDMSQDIVTYNFSADADEGTTNVYIIDVIGGHCGGNPGAAWIDVTEATRQNGTIGRWTLRPYIAAGGRP